MAANLEGVAFGEQLRREREQRGVGVEAICATTKVPVRHILSLEAGAICDLPGGVFRRGFVRSYLSALGLEESFWMARFEQSCRGIEVRDPGESAWTVFAENVKNSRTIQRRSGRSRSLLIVLILLLAALAGALAYETLAHRNLFAHPLRTSTLKSWVDNASSR